MKKTAVLILFVCLINTCFSQQFSLYNSRTLFDSFENPSQKAFQVDSSHKYAFNLLIPTIGINGSYSGSSQNAFKSVLFGLPIHEADIALGENKMSTFHLNTNTYLAMFRIFSKVKQNIEMGFSWQIRSDGRVNVSNETLAIFNNYKLFTEDQYRFNNNGYNQSYHQASYTYREDYSKRLSLGIKLSALNGITYNDLKTDKSVLDIDRTRDSISMTMKGTYRSNFKFSDDGKYLLYPKFKNPGFSMSFSASYKLKNNWLILGNLKDIGFIKWNKGSYVYKINDTIGINNASNGFGTRLKNRIDEIVISSEGQAGFTTLTNGKAEILINKSLKSYQPNLIVSKNLFDKGGDIALVNNYKVKNFVFSLSTDYNLYNYIQVGAQAMLKTPNVELFIGSDQLLQTYNTANSIMNTSLDGQQGYTGASFYMGFAFKFGPDMENPHNANTIPGMEDTNNNFGGIFRRIFSRK